jgi:hypothetical protein
MLGLLGGLRGWSGVLLAASVEGCCACGECGGVLRVRRVWRGAARAASVGRTLSPSASVVVLLKSDFLAYYC